MLIDRAKATSALGCIFFLTCSAFSQNIKDFRREAEEEYYAFKKNNIREYSDFREKANAEYEEFLRKPWTEKELDLLFQPKHDPEPEPVPAPPENDPIESNPVPIDTVIDIPKILPQPEPISPIDEIPITVPVKNVTLYGALLKVRTCNLEGFRLSGYANDDIADAWNMLCNADINNVLIDCLSIRDSHRLPDWAFFRLTDKVAEGYAPKNTNEHTLLMGFMLVQCGYKIRFMLSSDNKLRLLFGTKGVMYDRLGYKSEDTYFYAYDDKIDSKEVYLCDFGFDGEKDFSLALGDSPRLGEDFHESRNVLIKDYPGTSLSVGINKSLISLYQDYPNGSLDETPYSRWAIHGNTPVCEEVRNQLYPKIINVIKDMSLMEASHFLLRVAQSFEYGYDDEIWGDDRAFWMEESWYYPKSDCEDHAINFCHLIRDLLGLEVALVYYPGHLAAAVAFPGSVAGDYIMLDGKRYIVCDPTYFYANIGMTMPGMNNSGAVLIPLRKTKSRL